VIPRDSPSGLRFFAKLIELRLKERISEPFLRQVEVGIMPKRISDLCVTVEGARPREVTGLSKDARTPLMALVEWALRHGRIVRETSLHGRWRVHCLWQSHQPPVSFQARNALRLPSSGISVRAWPK
jgi:hypothetical protein